MRGLEQQSVNASSKALQLHGKQQRPILQLTQRWQHGTEEPDTDAFEGREDVPRLRCIAVSSTAVQCWQNFQAVQLPALVSFLTTKWRTWSTKLVTAVAMKQGCGPCQPGQQLDSSTSRAWGTEGNLSHKFSATAIAAFAWHTVTVSPRLPSLPRLLSLCPPPGLFPTNTKFLTPDSHVSSWMAPRCWAARLPVLIRNATLSCQGSASLLLPACTVGAVLVWLLMLRRNISSKTVCSRSKRAGGCCPAGGTRAPSWAACCSKKALSVP